MHINVKKEPALLSSLSTRALQLSQTHLTSHKIHRSNTKSKNSDMKEEEEKSTKAAASHKIHRSNTKSKNSDMEEEEEEEEKSTKAAGCKKNVTRLQRSFLHLSRALSKLHGRRGLHANANGETSLSSSSSAATSFLSGCMHPRTHSFASGRRRHRHKHDDGGGGGSGPGDALAVNFRSLRIDDEGGSSSAQDCYGDHGSEADEPKAVARGAGVAVATLSAAPYEDFRRSMREMVDAAAAGSGAAAAVDWDFMEELLFCYLRLNDRAVHKDILRAFTDTVAAIRRRRRAEAKSRRTRRRRRRREPAAGGDGRGNCDGAEAVTSISS